MNQFARCALSAALILALLVVPISSPAADPIEIDVILATSGASGFIGKEAATSFGVAEDAVNKAGGIGGRPLKFVVQDDQSSAQVAVQLVSSLMAKHVPVILGPNPVAACSAVAPIMKDKAVMFCMSAAYHPPSNTNLYVAGVSTIDQIIFAVRYLRERGLKKLATITSVDANGMDTDRGMELALGMAENKALSLVTAEHFNVSDVTVSAQIARMKSSGAQAVITGNNGTPLGVILHGYTDLGLTIPLVTTSGALNNIAMVQFANILPREFLVTGSLSDGADVVPPGPEKAAIRVYTNAFKRAGIEPDHSLSLPWDPALIVIGAFRKYGANATAEQVNSYIRRLRGWAGVNGTYDFHNGSSSGLDPNSLVMVRWAPDRKVWVPASKPGGAPLR
jgi:branched-chain amino acid transport system substrate-binding protein